MSRFTRNLGLGITAVAAVVLGYAFSTSSAAPPVQNPKLTGAIEGYVATTLTPQIVIQSKTVRSNLVGPSNITLGQPILLPDITVVAKNSGFTSKPAVTNPQGFFVITDLPEGAYQICVSGTGYTSQCDDQRVVVGGRFAAIVDHVVLISPAANAVAGTVWLSDRITPCFWFRPSVNPKPLVAKVTLVDSNQKVVAGPVTGNNLGQYVLPTTLGSGAGSVHAVCDAGIADAAVQFQTGPVLQDIALTNHAPQILSMDFTQGAQGVRRVNPGDTVHVTVQATDLDGDALHYHWSDDTGANLGLPDSPSVDWKVANAATTNTLHVQVTDGKGGITGLARSLQSGTDSLLFAGRVFDRQSLAPVSNADVKLNNGSAKTDASGRFHLAVPDAPKFVLNVNKPGFALASLVLRNRATNIEVPLDAAQVSTINAGTGGSIQFPPPGCPCRCAKPPAHPGYGGKGNDHDHDKDDRDRDKDDYGHGKGGGGNGCGNATGGQGLSVQFPAGALMSSNGAKYSGTASIEAFQYDLTKQNPIPGDFGAVYQGKQVRMATFGSFHIVARDGQGHPLKMASGKKVSISLPIQTAQLGVAPATIPFFHYDEPTGTWLEDGSLTRSGNRYVGHIAHFSAFNADTVFPGGACVKVVLDNSFVFPVTLSAVYLDPGSGSFNHNGSQSNDLIIGVERMTPNVNFSLTIQDSASATVTVPLNSGPGLDPVLFPGGLDTDQVNFSHCNGPVQISNNVAPANASKPYFLAYVTGGTITDQSAQYQQATNAQVGGSRNTFTLWKQANGFPAADEAIAVYFNNGDLKFGRDMHCRITNVANNALACYVSNFGVVGTDDAITAVTQAETYESSGQTVGTPVATVAMEYDPTKGANAVQFWAYHGDGSYFPNPALDSQGAKPMPNICTGCHFGSYNGSTTTGVAGAVFLPFDFGSFKDDTNQLYSSAHLPSSALQTQMHTLNNMIANTAPPAAVTQLVNQLWYANSNPATPYNFDAGAAQLPAAPFAGHEPLYDNVVRQDCRTCHVANPLPWNQFSLMNTLKGSIQLAACAPQFVMPNAEVPWTDFWQQNRNATLASELSFGGTGCPNH